MKRRLALVFLLALAAYVVVSLARRHGITSLEGIQAARADLTDEVARHPLGSTAAVFAAYVAVTALSLPFATVLTLGIGAVFGLLWGTVLVSFASSLGATLAFLGSRFLFRDAVRRRFGDRLRSVDEGFRKEGAFYLFTLRLLPVVPFFVVNLVMGLTPVRALTFYWVSQLGMLAGTLAYVNAGTRLGELHSLRGIVSPGLLASFAVLGVLPLAARRVLEALASRRALKGYKRPRRYDYNTIVIGGGSAGLIAAYTAAAAKAKVVLIERERLGGDCLNTGCVPSKALIRSANAAALFRRAPELGLAGSRAEVDFPAVMERVKRLIARIEPHDSAERYASLGVECLRGDARLEDPWTVRVGGRALTARSIVIATGAAPFVPKLPGLGEYLTSDTIWNLRELPRRLAVLGGGPIGAELGLAFRRLGSEVTIIDQAPHLLPREDEDVSAFARARFEREGIRVLTGRKVERVEGKALVCDAERIEFDQLLIALGRVARVKGFGLEELGLELRKDGTLATDERLRTRMPHILACGDVTGPLQFTHVAGHQAWHAALNGLFAPFKTFKVDMRAVPRVTFVDPEIARVGLSEREAREAGVEFELTRYSLEELDRAIVDGDNDGFVKVLTAPGSDRILGATIVAPHAGELLAELTLALRLGLGLNKILGTIHAYPTLTEAVRGAAGEWRKKRIPGRALQFAAWFHGFRRG